MTVQIELIEKLDGAVEATEAVFGGTRSAVHTAEDTLEAVRAVVSRDNAILPPVTRWVSASGRHVILERPPMIATIRYFGKKLGDIDETTVEQVYDLPIPWMVYGISLNDKGQPYDVRAYASERPIRGANDRLYLLPLPNYYRDGRFCLPNMDLSQEFTISEGINYAYNLVWGSNFNMDVTEALQRAWQNRAPGYLFDESRVPIKQGSRVSGANLYKRWAECSLDDLAKFSWPKVETGGGGTFRVGSLINQLRNEAVQYNANYLINTLRARLVPAVG